MPGEWIDLARPGVLRDVSPGLYEVELVEGDNVTSPPVLVQLRFTESKDWETEEGEPYLNPAARFIRCRRITDS